MVTQDFHLKSGSLFGRRVAELVREKKAVAKAVVENILMRPGCDPKNPVFISDGSSSSYVWCYFLRKWAATVRDRDALRIWTNNLDIPMQALCEPNGTKSVDIRIAPGEFSYKYCANFGLDSEKWVREHCDRCTCVLAVTALDSELGPCGKGEDAKAIKKAVMESANVLVIVTDHVKNSKQRDPDQAACPDEWKKWRDVRAKEGRLFVVTNKSPAVSLPFKRTPFVSHPDTRAPSDIESETLWALHLALKTQLIIADDNSSSADK